MGSKFQRYIAIGVIALVAVLIVVKIIVNQREKSLKWEEEDRQIMIDQCLHDLSGRAVLFPDISLEYCECTTDTLMSHYSKYEYFENMAKSREERSKEMTPVILECYNNFNAGMFDDSEMPD
jgi:hypothetical protein